MSMQKGDAYIFNTHLGVWIGRIVEITPEEVYLDDCSWIVQTGKWSSFVQKGTFEESEFCGDGVCVPRACVKIPWRLKLPTENR